MTNEEHAALRSELTRLRCCQVQSAFGMIPASIGHLERLLEADCSGENRQALYSLLLSEGSRTKNDALQIHLLRRRTHDLPIDPLSFAGLAFGLATLQQQKNKEAVEVAGNALQLAKFQNRQVRYCAHQLGKNCINSR